MMALKRSIPAVLVFGLAVVGWGLHRQSRFVQPVLGADAKQMGSVQKIRLPIKIPIVIVKYFPVDGERIDIKVTGDWGEPLAATRQKTERITQNRQNEDNQLRSLAVQRPQVENILDAESSWSK